MSIKLKAFLIHLAVSLIIFSCLFSLLLLVWYPEPYFTASGGWQGLKIVAMIDIVLGPLLTLVIYNSAKTSHELLQDYSFIVLVQLASLAWGVHIIYQNRPVAVVWWDDRFYTVNFAALKRQPGTQSNIEKLLEQDIPLLVVPPPKSTSEMADIMNTFFNQGIPPQQQINHYLPIHEGMPLIHSYAQAALPSKQVHWISSPSSRQILFFRLDSAYENLMIALDKEGHLLGYTKLDTSTSH